MPTKQVAVYYDEDALNALRRLAFNHGWPDRVLKPVITAAIEFFASKNITSYDLDNEALFVAHLRSALARRPDSVAAPKIKRGNKKPGRAAATRGNLQDPIILPGRAKRKADAGGEGDNEGTKQNGQDEGNVG